MSHNERFQSHQNKYGFRHNKHSKKTAKILALPNSGLCKKCYDIIEWRKKYRKYKPLKDPAKCADCNERTVKLAYHTLCSKCASLRDNGKGVCPKCCLSKEIIHEATSDLQQNEIIDMLTNTGVKERHRRTILRLWEKNEATDEEILLLIQKYDPNLKEEEDIKLNHLKTNNENHTKNLSSPLKASGVDNIPKIPTTAPVATNSTNNSNTASNTNLNNTIPRNNCAAQSEAHAELSEEEFDDEDEDEDEYSASEQQEV
jgi:hypothetical protein